MRYSDELRHVLAWARADAVARGRQTIGCEELLRSILANGHTVASAFNLAGLDTVQLAARLDLTQAQISGAENDRQPVVSKMSVALLYSSAASLVLKSLEQEAGDAEPVATEHLLNALIRQDPPTAALLAEHNVGRIEDGRLVRTRPPEVVAIDRNSRVPVFEQLIDGIEEAAAAGRLERGDRLPTVRQLATALGIAPGTVARA